MSNRPEDERLLPRPNHREIGEGPPGDFLEFSVRFGCGALIGTVIVLAVLIEFMPPVSAVAIILGITAVIGFGLAAAWFGEPFWDCLRERIGF